jgi:hypothetical protein
MEKLAEDLAFMNGFDNITGVLNGVVGQLGDLAESLGKGEGEIEELNAGKTAEEIAQEEAIAAEIAAPIVNALDSISAILNGATAQVGAMTAELFGGCEEANAR